MKFPKLCDRLATFFIPPRRKPDMVIGSHENPYMWRWFIIPRNSIFNIYLHKIIRSDDDRALHDHPWWSISFCLKGRMHEITKVKGAPYHEHQPRRLVRVIQQGTVVVRSAVFAHRLVIPDDGECWTLFITGPKIRSWGFHCPQGWRHWRDFVDPNDTGLPGKGCD